MIPFINLVKEYEEHQKELDRAVRRVLLSGRFILSGEVSSFEEEFSRYVGTKFAVGVNSGSDALYLALRALGIGQGDEVITSPHAFISVADAIRRNHARPVFVDIEPETYCLDPSLIEKALTRKTRAILPVHLYGHPADLNPIMEVARRQGVMVVEDACQAHGAEYRGRKVGGFGDAGCFSFYPTKNLGAFGDGGMVVTDSPPLAERLRRLRNYGEARKYFFKYSGVNSRLDEIQAALLRVKLRHLEKRNERRRLLAALYSDLLAGFPVITPRARESVRPVYHLYVIRCPKRTSLQDHLKKSRIQTLIHYPVPIHLQESCSDLGYVRGDFPLAEKCAKEVLSLPLYPELGKREVIQVVTAIQSFYR
jgi:dTDP-4-amino-4,6-dideoxygalactose transaminase